MNHRLPHPAAASLRFVAPGMAAALAVIAALAAGCAQNSIFELTLDLPPAPSTPDGPTYAFVQFNTANPVDFSARWSGQDVAQGFALDPTMRTTQQVSLIGDADVETHQIGMVVRFCDASRCTTLASDLAPISCVLFERVFYVGKTTSYPYTISSVPTVMGTCASAADVTMIEHCQIRGCVEGDTTNYCRSDDRHFCE